MEKLDKVSFLQNLASRKLLALNLIAALSYLFVLAFLFKPGNIYLFSLLIASEIFHVAQVLGFVYTVWPRKIRRSFDAHFAKDVDIFITVCGEPVAIVRETLKAVLAMDYKKKHVYLLNDGFVANKSNWRDIEKLAEKFGVSVITRKIGGGAKAGNINNAMRITNSPYIVIFDADHIPHADFLKKTMGYFDDPKVGFVQTPQFYYNQHENFVTDTAWTQQTLFFGPIMQGKDALNSAFMCGTNMVLNRAAIDAAGGMREDSIAEDFLTSLYVHAKGYKSVYVPEVLAEGLAPEDFLSYHKQQFRWTRGSLELIFKHNPFLQKGLSIRQKFQYLVSSGFYLNGPIVLLNALMPLVFLFTGLTAVATNSMLLAMIFLPYIIINLYTLQIATGYSYSYTAISFSLSSFAMQLKALFMILTGKKSSFAVTSKTKVEGSFIRFATIHILYILVSVAGLAYAIPRMGLGASVIANIAWIAVNTVIFLPFIFAASNGFNPSVRGGVKAARRMARRTSRQSARRARGIEGAES